MTGCIVNAWFVYKQNVVGWLCADLMMGTFRDGRVNSQIFTYIVDYESWVRFISFTYYDVNIRLYEEKKEAKNGCLQVFTILFTLMMS